MKKACVLLFLLITLVASTLTVKKADAQAPNPWETPQGQACFEQWISVSMGKLNAYNGGSEHNGRKPWSINRYGVLEGRPGVGPTSVSAPDNFSSQYNNNKYWYMWDAWVPAGTLGTWTYPEWNGAGIESVRSFVTACVAKSAPPPPATGITPPSGVPTTGGGPPPVGAPVPITWETQPTNVPGGSLRGRNGERFSFICPSGGPPSGRLWGTDIYTDDSSICIAAVHAGVITSANGGTVSIEIRPGLSSYAGSTRNGMTSSNWGSWSGSFSFFGAGGSIPPPGTYTLRTNKDTYSPGENMLIQYAGLPGNGQDWITVVKKGDSDSSYGQYIYTEGKTSGTWSIAAPSAGEYEVRLYLNWPSGGYNVVARYPFRVTGASTGAMSLLAPRRFAITNDLLLIPINLRNAVNVANLNFDVRYDAAIVRIEGNVLKGNLLDNTLFSVNPNQSGLVRGGFAQTKGLSGTGTVMNIPFRIIGRPGDKSSLNLSVTTINDPNGGNLNIERIHGEIAITNQDGTLPGQTGGPGNIPGATPGAVPKGDCDGDLAVSEADALCALEMSVQLRPVQLLMDLDTSGAVDSRDAVIILQRAVFK